MWSAIKHVNFKWTSLIYSQKSDHVVAFSHVTYLNSVSQLSEFDAGIGDFLDPFRDFIFEKYPSKKNLVTFWTGIGDSPALNMAFQLTSQLLFIWLKIAASFTTIV